LGALIASATAISLFLAGNPWAMPILPSARMLMIGQSKANFNAVIPDVLPHQIRVRSYVADRHQPLQPQGYE